MSSPSSASGPVSSTVTSARLASLTSRPVTEPALTPAIRTSEPWTMPKALYISISYSWTSSAPAAALKPAAPATSTETMSAILLMGPGARGGSQLIVPPSVNGVEPSPGSRSVAPGQRSTWP